MAIISEQENFLLKFKQESTIEGTKAIEVTVTKDVNGFMIDLKQEKKVNSIKIDFDSLVEIVRFINNRAFGKSKNTVSSTGVNGLSVGHEKENEQSLGIKELVMDISSLEGSSSAASEPKDAYYNSQADILLSNAANINLI